MDGCVMLVRACIGGGYRDGFGRIWRLMAAGGVGRWRCSPAGGWWSHALPTPVRSLRIIRLVIGKRRGVVTAARRGCHSGHRPLRSVVADGLAVVPGASGAWQQRGSLSDLARPGAVALLGLLRAAAGRPAALWRQWSVTPSRGGCHV